MRIYRELNADTKQRISKGLKNLTLSDSHKQAISDGMRAYWSTIPSKPIENNESKNLFNDENQY